MKKVALIISLVISLCAISLQAQDCNDIATSIISKIKKYSTNNLLPYYDKVTKKWGFMSKEGEILTQPLTYHCFNININYTFDIYYYKECYIISINLKDLSFTTKKLDKNDKIMEEDITISERKRDDLLECPTLPPLLKGFTIEKVEYVNKKTGEVSQKTEISDFSRIYWSICDPIMYNDKWYALVTLKSSDKKAIIDQDGNPLQNFDFKYKSLELLHRGYKGEDNNQYWFYFEDEIGNNGFINLEGDTKLKNELLSSYHSGSREYNYPYYIQENTEKLGVLDLRTLTWTIKPQTEFRSFNDFVKVVISDDDITHYVVVSDNDDKYLIDMNKKVYKPKKKENE